MCSFSLSPELKFAFMQVCQFNNATCGTFQALTQRGYMSVVVQNTGTLAADYQLQVFLKSYVCILSYQADHLLLRIKNWYTSIWLWGSECCECKINYICRILTQVASCSSTVSPILAQALALIARQSLSSVFEVYVQSPQAANLSCTVKLLDAKVNLCGGHVNVIVLEDL